MRPSAFPESTVPRSIPIDDVLCWNDLTAIHWRDWRDLLRAHPEILSLPCDIRNSQIAPWAINSCARTSFG
jgi:hypothetical protein